jgi:predicted glycoside hydrolase/deacetylase ChbG (UPF0249 family)
LSSPVLVVNADDFGFTRDVNAGIVEAYRCGIVRSTTLMANGAAFDDAVRLARDNPGLDIGCHLVLVGGRSLLRDGTPLPASVAQLARAVGLGRIRIHDELWAQVRRILDAGLWPTHLDTHKHTHLLPPVLDAVARLSVEFGIPWVRRPFDLPMKAAPAGWAARCTARGMALLRPKFHAVLERYGCRTTDHFAGFQLTGRLRTAELVPLIRSLPPGTTEFMCHPGRCGDELRCARTRLKRSREVELEALTAAETWRAVRKRGVRLAGFGELT